jgi:hypothetical protein
VRLELPLRFTPPRGGKPAFGYIASVLADLCDSYERIWEKKKDMACSDLIRRAVRQTVLGIRLERGFR